MTPVRFLLSVPPGRGRGDPDIAWHDRLEAIQGDRLSAWVADDADRISFVGGALFGRIFGRDSSRRLTALPGDGPSSRDPAAFAAWLTTQVWGGWFAVLHDGVTRSVLVARDPSPLLPVFRVGSGERVMYATDPGTLARAGARLQVSWPDLAAQLVRPELRAGRTCLEGMDEVVPGRLVGVEPSAKVPVKLWTPWEFATRPWRADRQEAAARLRAIAVQCMSAWTRDAGHVAVAASGGVDSSFICAALAVSGARFDCATVATSDPSGDESRYVRQLADALGVRVVKRTFDPADVDLTRPASAGLVRPVRKAFLTPFRRALANACAELGADTVFDGNGGDNLFAYLHSSTPALDRLWQHGPGRGFARTVVDLCRLTDMDLPAMIRALVVRAVRGPGQSFKPDATLLACGIADRPGPAPLLDWLADAPARRPGKRAHVAMLLRTWSFVDDLAGVDTPHAFSPLLSQPLVEFCLSVPTWAWCRDGINRSLARDAFAADLPASIVARVSKSGPDSFIRRTVARDRALLRELLLDGLLHSHGLLDARAVEAALRADALGDDPRLYRLLDFAEAETWARSWR